MSIVIDAVRSQPRVPPSPAAVSVKIALLGVGHVGGAVAALVRTNPLAGRFSIVSGLVRDITRHRPGADHVPLTCDPAAAVHSDPDIVIEALGGLEPARTLVLDALTRGIPVVTANKSLLAAYGAELLDAAERHAVPFRYEAAVLAGVPFLGTFTRRPLARAITTISGIVNGTSNFILSKMADAGAAFDVALTEAQRCGYAEPDPANDINCTDAVEKLCVLVRHFADSLLHPKQIERTGIDGISPDDLAAAGEFGGALKPVVHAEWKSGHCSAFAGPAFVTRSHPLYGTNGVQNAVLLRNGTNGDLFFAGPGAGPDVTAATLLDDAIEIVSEGFRAPQFHATARAPSVRSPNTGWFVRIAGEWDGQDPLSASGIPVKRSLKSGTQLLLQTQPCDTTRICRVIRDLEQASALRAFGYRVLAED